MNVDVQALNDRVQKLEDQNRKLKRYGLAALALAGVVTLSSMAAAVCNTVYAERFVLQDSGGNERARITAYETGGVPQFTLQDKRGRKALALGVTEDGRGYIEVADAQGKMVRSHFAVGAEGNATIEQPRSESKAKKDDAVSMLGR